MNNSKNTGTENKKIEDLINEFNGEIFDETIWNKKGLRKIPEVTYAYVYDKKNPQNRVNTTLFVGLGELNLNTYFESDEIEKKNLILKSRKKLEQIIKSKKELIDFSIYEIETLDYFSKESAESNLKTIFLNSLKEKSLFFDYTTEALDFEIEKAGFEIITDQDNREEKQEKLGELDKILFGGNIKDNSQESKLSYEYIYDIYIKNKNKLTSLEIERLEKYLEKAKACIGDSENYEYIEKEKPVQIDLSLLDIEIPRVDFMFGFNAIIEGHKSLEHIAETNEQVASISDGPGTVQIPTGEKYDFMPPLRFFRLSNHEFETHSITDYNGRQILGNMRGAESTEKDEGVAMLMEQLFTYGESLYTDAIDDNGDKVKIIDVEKIQINSYFSKTLMGELLTNDEFKDYLEIVEKIDPDVSTVQSRYDRFNRNNFLDYFVQHKDTTYTRGLLKAIAEINSYILSNGKEGTNPRDLFLGKISFKETKLLKKLKEQKEDSGEDLGLIQPLFMSDAVYYAVNEKLKGNEGNINDEGFYKYLRKKYPIFNFSEEEIKSVSFKTKSNVFGIVNILLKGVNKKNLDSVYKKSNMFNAGPYKAAMQIIKNQHNHKTDLIKKKMHPNRKNAK